MLSLINLPLHLSFPLLPPPSKQQQTTLRSFSSLSSSISHSSSSSSSIRTKALIPHENYDDSTTSSSSSVITLRRLCEGRVPQHIIQRAEDLGFSIPTDVQAKALPTLLSGSDCVIHSQTGSGKTLAYLLVIFSVVDALRSAVQALVVVPNRELGIQVAKVARSLAVTPKGSELVKNCTVMTLLDGGTLRRQRSWMKAETPQIIVATISSLCHMLERRILRLEALKVLVVDEVDFLLNSAKQASSLRKVLTSFSTIVSRQTVFASASIPQHNRFLSDCVQHKWTKHNVVHVQVHSADPMPPRFCHRFVCCIKDTRLRVLVQLLQADAPTSAIIFANEQSEKSKRTGELSAASSIFEFLKGEYNGCLQIHLLVDDMNFNARAASLSEVRQGGGFLLVSTDVAARGVDLPETTHIYNFDLPQTAVHYLHRAGRTGRRPFSDEKCTITTIISAEERFVLKKYENELIFGAEQLQV